MIFAVRCEGGYRGRICHGNCSGRISRFCSNGNRYPGNIYLQTCSVANVDAAVSVKISQRELFFIEPKQLREIPLDRGYVRNVDLSVAVDVAFLIRLNGAKAHRRETVIPAARRHFGVYR